MSQYAVLLDRHGDEWLLRTEVNPEIMRLRDGYRLDFTLASAVYGGSDAPSQPRTMRVMTKLNVPDEYDSLMKDATTARMIVDGEVPWERDN